MKLMWKAHVGPLQCRGQIGTGPIWAALTGPAWALHSIVGWDCAIVISITNLTEILNYKLNL